MVRGPELAMHGHKLRVQTKVKKKIYLYNYRKIVG
jgi:hypothetical protein